MIEFQLEQAIDILSRTAPILNSLLRDISEGWVLNDEGAESWNPYDVVGHLIQGEEADWIPRAKIILQHGQSRPFQSFDRFAMFERFKGESLGKLLDMFAELRGRNLETLRRMDLTPEKLTLRGTHPELGAVTLGQLLSTWVVHDLSHIGQIARVMCKQYSEAVGPWKAFLPILTRSSSS